LLVDGIYQINASLSHLLATAGSRTHLHFCRRCGRSIPTGPGNEERC